MWRTRKDRINARTGKGVRYQIPDGDKENLPKGLVPLQKRPVISHDEFIDGEKVTIIQGIGPRYRRDKAWTSFDEDFNWTREVHVYARAKNKDELIRHEIEEGKFGHGRQDLPLMTHAERHGLLPTPYP